MDTMERPAPQAPQVVVQPGRLVSVKLAATVLGRTEASIRARMARGIWLLGVHYRKAEDGSVWIDLKAVDKWILGDD